ncbi:MAG: hypothetical protein Alpg2KO_01230 [Alphaproteobacteria bacterium]
MTQIPTPDPAPTAPADTVEMMHTGLTDMLGGLSKLRCSVNKTHDDAHQIISHLIARCSALIHLTTTDNETAKMNEQTTASILSEPITEAEFEARVTALHREAQELAQQVCRASGDAQRFARWTSLLFGSFELIKARTFLALDKVGVLPLKTGKALLDEMLQDAFKTSDERMNEILAEMGAEGSEGQS